MTGDDGAGAGIFDRSLPKTQANHRQLTPLDFLAWAEQVFRDRVGVIYAGERRSWGETGARCRRLADALRRLGVGKGDTVAILCPNTPPMLEAHYGVPMAGAVLNALNLRLDAGAIAFCLGHGESKVLLADTEWAPVVREAVARLGRAIEVVDVVDPAEAPAGERVGRFTYEELLATGDPAFPIRPPADEWDALSLCYTSGTTGDPKGVVYHHRGAYLNALGNALVFGLRPTSAYLWTLPMFHCNGWTHTWGVTAAGGTHVCLRKVEPARIFEAIAEHGVTHMCGAPVVLTMLIHAPQGAKRSFPQTVEIATGGAAPPSAVIAGMEAMGFKVTHLYGLTESYGPSMVGLEQPGWAALPLEERAALVARQGVRYPTLGELAVLEPETSEPVPADATTLGEIALRGHTVMKGYLKNPAATAEAFRGDWYRTGDLAVLHADGYAEVKDRAKDVIITGGENVSSLEVEEALYRHPDVMEAAVVARPDSKWGESPCAFVTLKSGGAASEAELVAWCRQHLARFKVPKTVIFGPLPKTSTGKIQKFELRARARALGPVPDLGGAEHRSG